MLPLPHGWQATTERGPNWLLLRLRPPAAGCNQTDALAEVLYNLLDEHSTYRVVLDLEEVPAVRSAILNEILRLSKRVAAHDGVVRLCGLSTGAQQVVNATKLDRVIASYPSRRDAMMAGRTVTVAT